MQVLLFASFSSCPLSFPTIFVQSEMEVNVGNELPSRFPEKDTERFPSPWHMRDLPPNSHKTPDRDSAEWKAIMKFRNSTDWKTGDLQKFANYFGVRPSSLCWKIKESQKDWLPQRSDEVATEGAGSSHGTPTSSLPPCSPPSRPGGDDWRARASIFRRLRLRRKRRPTRPTEKTTDTKFRRPTLPRKR